MAEVDLVDANVCHLVKMGSSYEWVIGEELVIQAARLIMSAYTPEYDNSLKLLEHTGCMMASATVS